MVLYTFTPNKSYIYLLNLKRRNLVFLETYNTEFNDIKITFTDRNGRLLEIQDKSNLMLLINHNKTRLFEGRFFLRAVSVSPLSIFQEELFQCRYNFIQLLNNQFKVG